MPLFSVGVYKTQMNNRITHVYKQTHKEAYSSQSNSRKEKFSWNMSTEGKGQLIYADVFILIPRYRYFTQYPHRVSKSACCLTDMA